MTFLLSDKLSGASILIGCVTAFCVILRGVELSKLPAFRQISWCCVRVDM